MQEHPDPLGEHQRRQEVALHPFADPLHVRRVGGALVAPVAGVVLVLSVPVVVPVGLVVLVVVGDQVVQREAVVGGHEVDRPVGATAASLVQIARPREAERHL